MIFIHLLPADEGTVSESPAPYQHRFSWMGYATAAPHQRRGLPYQRRGLPYQRRISAVSAPYQRRCLVPYQRRISTVSAPYQRRISIATPSPHRRRYLFGCPSTRLSTMRSDSRKGNENRIDSGDAQCTFRRGGARLAARSGLYHQDRRSTGRVPGTSEDSNPHLRSPAPDCVWRGPTSDRAEPNHRTPASRVVPPPSDP